MTQEQRAKALATLTANCSCAKTKSTINALTDEQLEYVLKLNAGKLTANAKAEGSNADVQGGGTVQAGGEEDEEDSKPPKGTKKTMNQWLQDAPQEAREILNSAKKVLDKQREQTINRLTAHIQDKAQKDRLTANLSTKSMEELDDLVMLQGPAYNQQQQEYSLPPMFPPNMNGQVTDNAAGGEDILPLPRGLFSANENDDSSAKTTQTA